jgi:hypothetical protein
MLCSALQEKVATIKTNTQVTLFNVLVLNTFANCSSIGVTNITYGSSWLTLDGSGWPCPSLQLHPVRWIRFEIRIVACSIRHA